MAFTDDDFIEILEYCKNMDNFRENTKICFDNIKNVSDSLIEDERFWLFDFDHICENIYGKSSSLPASTDGLEYVIGRKNNTIYFIEFKNFPMQSVDYKYKLKTIKKSLKKNHCYCQQEFCPIKPETLKSLDNISSTYEDERICKLKLKTTESMFFVMPKLFEYYKKNNPDFDKTQEEFISWLLKSDKRFIIVFADDDENIPNNHFSFETKLRDKYRHFKNVAHIKTSFIKKKDFEKDFMENYFPKIETKPV